jgi:hypothetical protein
MLTESACVASASASSETDLAHGGRLRLGVTEAAPDEAADVRTQRVERLAAHAVFLEQRGDADVSDLRTVVRRARLVVFDGGE